MSSHTNEMTMVERVATAIWGNVEYDGAYETQAEAEAQRNDDERNGHEIYDEYRSREEMHKQARRAIEALRDPSESMIEAMRANGSEGDDDQLAADFRAAIDAALQEKQP